MQITRKGSELFYTLGKNAPAEVGAGSGEGGLILVHFTRRNYIISIFVDIIKRFK